MVVNKYNYDESKETSIEKGGKGSGRRKGYIMNLNKKDTGNKKNDRLFGKHLTKWGYDLTDDLIDMLDGFKG